MYISIHAPLAGCDKILSADGTVKNVISIHAPLAGCDRTTRTLRCCRSPNFNPRTPCGVRLYHLAQKQHPTDFNPRTPCGARRAGCAAYGGDGIFQSTHPLRGATHELFLLCVNIQISIHAPLAGCDGDCRTACCCWHKFQSTHPLRGATATARATHAVRVVFQSTHPLRGATGAKYSVTTTQENFNPRTPCGVRRESSA